MGIQIVGIVVVIALLLLCAWCAWELRCNSLTYKERVEIIDRISAAGGKRELWDAYDSVTYEQHHKALTRLRKPKYPESIASLAAQVTP